MIISEQIGRLVGFRYDGDCFQFQAEVYPTDLNCGTQSVYFPFNRNRPKAVDLDEFRGKRVKMTIEMEEE